MKLAHTAQLVSAIAFCLAFSAAATSAQDAPRQYSGFTMGMRSAAARTACRAAGGTWSGRGRDNFCALAHGESGYAERVELHFCRNRQLCQISSEVTVGAPEDTAAWMAAFTAIKAIVEARVGTLERIEGGPQSCVAGVRDHADASTCASYGYGATVTYLHSAPESGNAYVKLAHSPATMPTHGFGIRIEISNAAGFAEANAD